jgi:hypothetical protein
MPKYNHALSGVENHLAILAGCQMLLCCLSQVIVKVVVEVAGEIRE